MSHAQTTEPKLKTFANFPTYLRIDGARIDVQIKRQTNLEATAWAASLQRWSDTPGPDGETPEQRLTREQATEAELRVALDHYLTILPGQMQHEGQPVTRASQLLDIYGGRFDVVPQAIALITAENRLTDAEKKTYRSVLDSSLGLPSEPESTANGSAPATTAANAAAPASARHAAATAVDGVMSSGTTGPSRSGRALSGRSRRSSGRRSGGSI